MSPDIATSRDWSSLPWNGVLDYIHQWAERLFLCAFIVYAYSSILEYVLVCSFEMQMKSFFSILALYFCIDTCTVLSESLFRGEGSTLVKGWVKHRLRVSSPHPLLPPVSKLSEEGIGTHLGLPSMIPIFLKVAGAERLGKPRNPLLLFPCKGQCLSLALRGERSSQTPWAPSIPCPPRGYCAGGRGRMESGFWQEVPPGPSWARPFPRDTSKLQDQLIKEIWHQVSSLARNCHLLLLLLFLLLREQSQSCGRAWPRGCPGLGGSTTQQQRKWP